MGCSAASRGAGSRVLLAAAVLCAALSSTAVAACGEYLPDTDVPGDNMPGSPFFVDSPEACIALCEDTDTCSAIITFPNGACFLKSVDVNTVQPYPRAGMTSYLLCPPCGVLMPDTDIPGANMPGSPTFESGAAACQDLCESTATCNAYIIFPNGACFLKSVDVDTVQPFSRAGMSSYLFCGGAQCDATTCSGLADPEQGDTCFTKTCNGDQCEVTRAPDGTPCTTPDISATQPRLPGGGLCFVDGEINSVAGCGCGPNSCEGFVVEGDPVCFDIVCSIGTCYPLPNPAGDLPGSCANDNYSICDSYMCLADGQCTSFNLEACGPPEASSCQAFTCSIEDGAAKGTCVCA